MKKTLLAGLSFLFATAAANAQAGAYTDPAQAFVRLLLDRSDNSFILVGNYKVKGTPYLFGEKNRSDVYAKDGMGKYVFVNYNTYTQSVEIFQTKDAVTGIEKEAASIDSFSLSPQNNEPLFFINGSLLGAKDKGFYQRVATGSKLQLYKRYKSDLGVVSTNYIQSELRQFNLSYDYYYYDVEKKTIKKLRADGYSLKKEFSKVADVSPYLENDALTVNPELTLKAIFAALNN